MKPITWFDRQSASDLVNLACLGGVASAAAFYSIWYFDLLTKIAVAAALLIPAGIALYFAAKRSLDNGIAAQRWTRAELDPLIPRVLTIQRIAAGLMFALCVASIVRRHVFHQHHSANFPWFIIFFFSQTQVSLRNLLQPPAPPRPQKTLWIEAFKPIQSEHWGSR